MSLLPDRDIGADALTDNERAVLVLFDAGLPERRIVARLQLAASFVRYVISTFAHTELAQRRFEARARIGSAQLAAAIAATGRCHS